MSSSHLLRLAIMAGVAQGTILSSPRRSGIDVTWYNPRDRLEVSPTPQVDVDAIKAAEAKRERRAARNIRNAAKEFFPKRY